MRIEKKETKKKKQENVVELTEDVRLPKTGIILEKGDKIEVMKEEQEERKRFVEGTLGKVKSCFLIGLKRNEESLFFALLWEHENHLGKGHRITDETLGALAKSHSTSFDKTEEIDTRVSIFRAVKEELNL